MAIMIGGDSMIPFRVGDSCRFTALHTCHHELMSAFAVFL
jgi:hypothetical protein